jgi:glycosyltransferase involved in cell wall biosynthesis
MKILSIGSDRNLFQPASAVRERIIGYANLVDETHIIVFAQKSLGLVSAQISPKLWIYPTNSRLKLFYIFDAVKLVKKLKLKIDLVTCQDPFESGLTGWLISRRELAQLELQIHTDIGSPYFWQESFKNKIRFLLAKFLLPKADKIRVVSQRIADFLKSASWRIKAEIEIRPIFVDIEKIKNTPITVDLHKKYQQFDKIILMASRLTKEKNIDLAIEAVSSLIRANRRIGLIIVGSGPEEKILKLKAISYKLEASIIFENWVNQETLYSYYKTCDLFLVTSLYEGYGMTLVETQAAGCKIVSTDVGVAREVGVRIIGQDFANVAKGVIELLQ